MTPRQVAWAAVAVIAAGMLLRHYPPPMWVVWIVILVLAARKAWPPTS